MEGSGEEEEAGTEGRRGTGGMGGEGKNGQGEREEEGAGWGRGRRKRAVGRRPERQCAGRSKQDEDGGVGQWPGEREHRQALG